MKYDDECEVVFHGGIQYRFVLIVFSRILGSKILLAMLFVIKEVRNEPAVNLLTRRY